MEKFPFYKQYDQMDCGPTLRCYNFGGQACLRNLSDRWRMINKTPVTFMNGYELPVAYRMKDLSVLIQRLVEVFNNQNGVMKTKRNSGSAKISEKQKNV